jgi:hypothetical protein
MNQLSFPPEAEAAQEAVELFRGWLIDRRLVCSLLPTAFDQPLAWGILLADAAHHVANALAERYGVNREQVLSEISKAFAREINEPTDAHFGEFIHPST